MEFDRQRRVQVFTRSSPQKHAYQAPASPLNRLFENQLKVAPEPAAAPPPVDASPKALLRLAQTEVEVTTAAHACLAGEGLPLDAEMLAKVLAVRDERLLSAAMESLLDVLDRGRPKNAKQLLQAIVAAHDYLRDTHALFLAKGLRTRLAPFGN